MCRKTSGANMKFKSVACLEYKWEVDKMISWIFYPDPIVFDAEEAARVGLLRFLCIASSTKRHDLPGIILHVLNDGNVTS